MGLGIKTLLRRLHRYAIVEKFPDKRLKSGDTTQYGEFRYLFNLLNSNSSGLFVDVGANDGYKHSNSYPFIQLGWKALLLEPDPQVFQKLSKLHKGNLEVRCLNCAAGEFQSRLPLYLGSGGQSGYSTLSAEESEWYNKNRSSEFVEVDVIPLSQLLHEYYANPKIDIISIDTEGYDYFVLKGLDCSIHKPTLIITEDEKPPFTNMRNKEELLRANGYQFLRRFHNNAIWMEK